MSSRLPSNPICTHSLNITRTQPFTFLLVDLLTHLPIQIDNGVNLTAPIVDFCAACPDVNVGLSDAGFQKFAPLSDGIVPGVVWNIV